MERPGEGEVGVTETLTLSKKRTHPGHNIIISNIGKPKPTEERGTMFEWICIILSFCIPNQSTDQTWVLMVIPFPVQGPKDKRGGQVGAALGYLYLISTPPLSYFCPALQIDPILIFMKSKVRSLGIKFNSEYVLTDFVYLASCNL